MRRGRQSCALLRPLSYKTGLLQRVLHSSSNTSLICFSSIESHEKMYSRRSPGLFLALALAMSMLMLALHCEAQVNFSPSWGKRAPGAGGVGAAMAGESPSPCRASAESLLYIYKLVQNEAQKLLNCEKFSE